MLICRDKPFTLHLLNYFKNFRKSYKNSLLKNAALLFFSNDSPRPAHSLPDAVHEGHLTLHKLMQKKRYLVLLLKKSPSLVSCDDFYGSLHMFKSEKSKTVSTVFDLQYYDVSYLEKDSKPLMKLSRPGYEAVFGGDIAELLKWFEASFLYFFF